MLSGRLEARLDGRELSLGPGQSAVAPAGVAHDWWNGSKTEEAHVLVEIAAAPGGGGDADRFELLIGMLFGLANDGKVDRRGRPHVAAGRRHRPRSSPTSWCSRGRRPSCSASRSPCFRRSGG